MSIAAQTSLSDPASERIAAAQQAILDMLATGAPLQDTLRKIAAMIESQSSDDLCSILLLGDDQRLHVGAGGALPDAYNSAIEGIRIGPAVGSCGTAAFTRQRVVVADIATDPHWKGYAAVALKYGLRACWSQPIVARDGGQVLGTVANYSRHPGQPTARSLQLLESAARFAQIAMQQEESSDLLRKHTTVLHSLPDAIVLADERGRISDINPAAERLFGCTRLQALGNGIGLVHGGQLQPPLRTDPILQTLANGVAWRGQVRIDRKGDESAVCESIVLPLKDADGSMIGMLGVNHELTDSKRIAERRAT